MIRRRVTRAIVGSIVLIAVMTALLPLAYGAVSALSPDGRSMSLDPSTWVWDNYRTIFALPEFSRALTNSVIVSTATVAISILAAIPAAYVLTRAPRPTDNLALGFLATRMVPGIVLIIPIYLLYRDIGLIDSQLGLVVAYLTFGVPFAVWMLWGFFAEVPREMDDAAALDGIGHIAMMWRILVPITRGGILSTAVLLFVFCWNEFLFATLLMTGDGMTFIPLITRFVLPQGPLYGQIFAGATVFLLPPMVALLLIRNRLSEAFSLGGIQ